MAKLSAAELMAAMKAPQRRSQKKEVAEDSKYTAEEKAQMDREGKGLSGAAKEWAAKFAEMNDSEFWLAFCFYSDDDLRAFGERVGVSVARGEAIMGRDFTEAIGVDMSVEELPSRRMVKFAPDKAEIRRALTYEPLPDPLEGVETPEDLEVAAKLELSLLQSALEAGTPAAWLEKNGSVDDYPYWFAVIFADRASKEKFLRLTGLDNVGNKYMDGYRSATVLFD